MAKDERVAGATSVILEVFAQNSASTTGAGLTGLVFNSASLTAYYKRDADSAAVAITLANITTIGTFANNGFREVDATNMPGVYEFDPPNAAFAANAKTVTFMLKGATNLAPVVLEVALKAINTQNAAWFGITADIPSNLTGNVNGSVLGNLAGNVNGSVLGNLVGNVNGSVLGNLAGNVNGNVLGTVANVAGNVNGSVLGNIAGNVNGSVLGNLVGNVNGNVLGTVANVAGNVNGNVLGTVANVAGNVNGSVLGNLAGNVNGNILGNVAGTVASVTGAVGSVAGNVNGNVTGSIGSLAAQAKLDVNAEVVDGLNVDTYAQPGQGTPAATQTIRLMIAYMYKAWRNKTTQTATEYDLFNDDAATVDQKATFADDGTTATRGEVATGP